MLLMQTSEQKGLGESAPDDLNRRNPVEWYDTHTHLNDEAFADDASTACARAKLAGVNTMNIIGYDLPSSLRAIELAENLRQYAAVGIHPHDASTWNDSAREQMRAWLKNAVALRIVAVGEIGLDYYYDHSPRECQRRAFAAQLRLAYEFDLPVVIHDREAHADTYELLCQAKVDGYLRDIPGVLHCYSGSVEMAEKFLALGFYLGIDGPLTFKNAKVPLAVVAAVPSDRLLLETDCPYLTPVPYRGHRNEPSYIPLIGAKVAEIRQCPLEQIAATTTANAKKLFNI